MTRPTTHTDPSGLFAAVGGLVNATLVVIAVFVPLPDGLTEALLGLVAAAGPVVTALAIRRHAYAPATVHALRARVGDLGGDV